MNFILQSSAILLLVIGAAMGAQAAQAPEQNLNSTSTSVTQKLFTYTGPLLPTDWTLVSVLNDRAVIGFKNGSARNALMEELEPKDRNFLQRLQNGTVYSTPLASAKEKLSQWSSSVTSTVSKFGKSVKDQFDTLINKKDSSSSAANSTAVVL